MLLERLLAAQSFHNSPSKSTVRCCLENIPKQNSVCFTEWAALPAHRGSSGVLAFPCVPLPRGSVPPAEMLQLRLLEPGILSSKVLSPQ